MTSRTTSPFQSVIAERSQQTGCPAVTRLEFSCSLDESQIVDALRSVIARHEVLREAPNGLDLRRSDFACECDRHRDEPASRSLLDSRVLRLSTLLSGYSQKYILEISSLAVDRGSLPIMLAELMEYRALPDWDAAPEYSKFAAYLQEYAISRDGAELAQHFADRKDYFRSNVRQSYWSDRLLLENSSRYCTLIDYERGETELLRDVCDRHGMTLPSVVLASWALLAKCSTKSELTSLAVYGRGRRQTDVADVLGPMGQFLPLIVSIEDTDSVLDIARALAADLEAEEQKADGYALNWQPELGSFHFAHIPVEGTTSGLDVTDVGETGDVAGHFLTLVTTDSSIRLILTSATEMHLDILSCRLKGIVDKLLESDGLLHTNGSSLAQTWAKGSLGVSGETMRASFGSNPSSVLEALDSRITSTPDAVAMRGNIEYTFSALSDRSIELAKYWQSEGVSAGTRVVLALPKEQLPPSIIALWRLGATPVLSKVGRHDLASKLAAECAAGRVVMELPTDDLGYLHEEALVGTYCDHTSPAYIAYTSGSTGRRKVLSVSHGSFLEHLQAMRRRLDLKPSDRYAALAEPEFDVLWEQLFLPLVTGAAVVPLTLESGSISDVFGDLVSSQVTVLNTTPSVWRVLSIESSAWLDSQNEIRIVILGGESLSEASIESVHKLLPRAALFNAYGPAEAVVTASLRRVRSIQDSDNIGSPVGSRRFVLLSTGGEPVPEGAPGEIVITAILASGYVDTSDREESERFTQLQVDGVTIDAYFTGDYGYSLGSEGLRFTGRVDREVKVRGRRLDLSEYEASIKGCLRVEAVAALADSARTTLVVGTTAIPVETIRKLIDARLLHQPDLIVLLDSLPFTASGKVDYGAIASRVDSDAHWQDGEQPHTEEQRLVANFWREVLQRSAQHIDQDFFDVGGHSLSAIDLSIRISSIYPGFNVVSVMRSRTIRKIAMVIEGLNRSGKERELVAGKHRSANYEYDMSHAERRMWFSHHSSSSSAAYNVTLAYSNRRLVDPTAIKRAWDMVVGTHEALRTSYHTGARGPYGLVSEKVQWEIDVSYAESNPLGAVIQSLQDHRYDLSNAPLWRVSVVQGEVTSVVISLHHIITDLIATKIIVDSFFGALRGKNPPTPRLSYADYADWERERLRRGAWDDKREYLLDQLAHRDSDSMGASVPVAIEPNFVDSAGCSADISTNLGTAITNAVELVAESNAVTSFTVLLAAYARAYSRFLEKATVVIGMPTSNRPKQEFNEIVGCFVGVGFVHLTTSAFADGSSLIQHVNQKVLGMLAAQEYPFNILVSEYLKSRSKELSASPIFDTMFAHEERGTNLPDTWEPVPVPDRISKYSISGTTWYADDVLQLTISYDSAVYGSDDVRRLTKLFFEELRQISTGGGRSG